MAEVELSSANPPSDRIKGALILTLAGVAGYVDAVGFLNLANLFTTHMSGNSAATGAYFGQRQWAHALTRLYPIPIFVAGVICGAILTEEAVSRRARSVFWLPLAVEIVLLAVYLLAGEHARHVVRDTLPFYALAALPAFAMGVQNTTVRRVGHSSVRTTYVTGMLTNFAEGIVSYLFWRRERGNDKALPHADEPDPAALGRAFLFGGIWLVFVVGATLGSLANTYWSFRSLLVPIAGLLVVLIFDLRRPLYSGPK